MSHWETTPVFDELNDSTDTVFEPIEVVETLSDRSAFESLLWLAFAILLLNTPAIVWAAYRAAF